MSKAKELAAEVEGLERGKHKRRRYPAGRFSSLSASGRGSRSGER